MTCIFFDLLGPRCSPLGVVDNSLGLIVLSFKVFPSVRVRSLHLFLCALDWYPLTKWLELSCSLIFCSFCSLKLYSWIGLCTWTLLCYDPLFFYSLPPSLSDGLSPILFKSIPVSLLLITYSGFFSEFYLLFWRHFFYCFLFWSFCQLRLSALLWLWNSIRSWGNMHTDIYFSSIIHYILNNGKFHLHLGLITLFVLYRVLFWDHWGSKARDGWLVKFLILSQFTSVNFTACD